MSREAMWESSVAPWFPRPCSASTQISVAQDASKCRSSATCLVGSTETRRSDQALGKVRPIGTMHPRIINQARPSSSQGIPVGIANTLQPATNPSATGVPPAFVRNHLDLRRVGPMSVRPSNTFVGTGRSTVERHSAVASGVGAKRTTSSGMRRETRVGNTAPTCPTAHASAPAFTTSEFVRWSSGRGTNDCRTGRPSE